ncbi:hypothetical protein C1D09_016405 [Mesorhizobium intechi]|uniref:Uncharacterized protein n=1 Tax=Mesorhizobium intechi TaxID=537601 RepID=A0A8T9ANW8_9HYPH|nr:hypothetical protein [Mesorhizobium intechi]TSE09203.1 hypothetical protein C1D09_016405 [Mesorhizobium intechi]
MRKDTDDVSKSVEGILFQEPGRPPEVWLRGRTAMPRYQIDEMDGDELLASHVASGATALEALRKITGKTTWTPALRNRWFRVVDESEGHVFEYSVAHDFTPRR